MRGASVEVERLATAFSPAVFRALAGQGGAATLDRVAGLAEAFRDVPELTLGGAFELAYSRLSDEYQNEYHFKAHLISKIVFGRHSPRTAAALLELPMGKSCADLVIVNGTSTAYEIKTDLDDFSRLSGQVSDYSTRVEHVNVVVSIARASVAEARLPDHVGVVAIAERGRLRTIRPSSSRIDAIEVDHLYQLLRGAEARSILKRTLGFDLDVGSGLAWPRMREVFRTLEVRTAHAEVVCELRSRGQKAGAVSERPEFPPSLRPLAYSTILSRRATDRVLEQLARPILEFA